jgi:hypothetical protein
VATPYLSGYFEDSLQYDTGLFSLWAWLGGVAVMGHGICFLLFHFCMRDAHRVLATIS